MTFAYPWWLLLMALSGLIFVLHMRRRRRVPISSHFLWRRLPTEASDSAHARPPIVSLPLILQLLVLCLIALALARPIADTSKAPAHLLMVLDASASMQAVDVQPSRFEKARADMVDYVRSRLGGHDTRVTVIVAQARPYFAGARLTSAEDVAAAVSSVRGSDTATDWASVAGLLSIVHNEEERTDVILWTDVSGQQEGRAVIASRLPGATIASSVFDGDGANAAFLDAQLDPPSDTETWRLAGEIQTTEGHSGNVTVQLHFRAAGATGFELLREVDVAAAPGGITSFEFDFGLPGEGVLEARLPEDHMRFDNHAYFVAKPSARELAVLHVGPDNAQLVRALASIEGIVLTATAELPVDSETYDLVIVDRASVVRHPGTNTLWIDVLPPPSSSAREQLTDPTPTGWDRDHPLANAIDWESIEVREARRAPILSGAEVLFEAGGHPLIQVRSSVSGHDILVAFALADATWIEEPSFPKFMTNLARWLEPDVGGRIMTACKTGERCALATTRVLERIVGPDGRAALTTPFEIASRIGSAPEWQLQGRTDWFVPEVAGLYTLVSGEIEIPLAVNAFLASESRLPPATGEALELLGELRVRVWWGAWKVLLAVAVIVIVGEAVVAAGLPHRAARPVSRGLGAQGPFGARRESRLWVRRALGLTSVALIALALIEVPAPYPSRPGRTVLIVDEPAWLSDADRVVVEQVIAAARRRNEQQRDVGWISAGASPSILADIGTTLPDAAESEEGGSDLEASFLLALAMTQGQGSDRIVLITTGQETRGRAATALSRILEQGTAVDLLPLSGMPEGEVLVEAVLAPALSVASGPTLLHSIVFSDAIVDVDLRVWRDGSLFAEQRVALQEGRNRIEIPVQELEPGAFLYEVEIQGGSDVIAQNNRAGAYVFVRAAPRIGIFTGQQEWGAMLADALEVQGLDTHVATPDRAPYYVGHENASTTGWQAYDAAVLLNVPSIDLQSRQQETLQTWVRDFGGGLLLLGGENTFGPGGYHRASLEEMLPLSTDIPQERPTVAMSFVLDRSGSMRQAVGEATRLDVAKQALYAAVEILDEESLVSVIVFDSDAQLLVPLESAGADTALRALLEPLQPGGGTSIHPGLEMALEEMLTVDPELTRHIVVMTDGLSQGGDFAGVLDRITSAGITVSTAAIGRGADVGLLESIARWGGGVSHATTDFEALPSILAQEALLLTDEPIQLEPFEPIRGETDAHFMRDLPDVLPQMLGHVLTTAKPGADIHLFAPDSVPLLASWRYGLGHVAALASHGVGPWAAPWLALEDYPRFLAQLVRWTLPDAPSTGLRIEVDRDGDMLVVRVEAQDTDGNPSRGLDLRATLTVPDRGRASVQLQEDGAGTYRGTLSLDAVGTHYIEVVSSEQVAGGPPASADTMFFVAYPARFDLTRPVREELAVLSLVSEGHVLDRAGPYFVNEKSVVWTMRAGGPLWIVLGLATFLLELTMRYAPMGVRWLARPLGSSDRPS